MKQKTASLAASLIATKRAAVPSPETPLKTVGKDIKQLPGESESTEKRTAITVKLLESPYLRMKAYGAANRVSNQNMLEEALNDYLNKVGA
jgi:hypothetical protein